MYLTDLSQFVKNNRAKSDHKSVKCDVPQGSVLGPLFSWRLNDIFHASQLLNNILYVDDTCIYMYLSGKDLHSLIGYEPAGLTVHPPPLKMSEGGFIFFVWVSSATKIFSSK